MNARLKKCESREEAFRLSTNVFENTVAIFGEANVHFSERDDMFVVTVPDMVTERREYHYTWEEQQV